MYTYNIFCNTTANFITKHSLTFQNEYFMQLCQNTRGTVLLDHWCKI